MQNIAVLGTGNISDIYFENLTKTFNKKVKVVGCYDLIEKLATDKAKKYNVKKVYKNIDELLADAQVNIVLNLTRPNEHFATTKKILKAKKHAYSEKPLATKYKDGVELVKLAKKNKVLLGGAPDTFLGAGISKVKRIIDSGKIGKITSVTANMMSHGHETWHPGPEFYYKKGGGPMFDMGPYYLTALIYLCGNITTVSGLTNKALNERLITSQPLNGTKIKVDVPTHITGLLEFENGAIGNITTSFDTWKSNMPLIEIHGTDGSIEVPDPNAFSGPVELSTTGSDWKEQKIPVKYSENSRGIGVIGMAQAIKQNKNFAANHTLTLQVLEVMEKIHTSNTQKKFQKINTKYKF